MRSLVIILSLLVVQFTHAAGTVQTNGIFGGLLLGGTTNIISDNGTTLTRNGSAISGGGGIVGTVSNSVASAGLLAVDATKTNGVAATFAMVTNALGYFPLTNSFSAVTNALGYLPATNASLGSYVLKAGDTMTGALASPAVDFTTPATITPIDAGTLLDFNAATRFASCTLTGSVTFTASNYAVGKTYTVRIINNQVTNVSVAWPWAKMAGGTVTNFFAGTTNLLQAQCWGTASSDVIATCVQLQ